MTDGFKTAPYAFLCVDVWPPGTLKRSVMEAYKHLDGMKRIQIRYPVRVVAERTIIEYLSPVPQEWIREEIRDKARQIEKQTVEQCIMFKREANHDKA